MKKGGATTSRAVSPGCRNGMVKDATGKCVMERKFKTGGTKKYGEGGPTTKPISTPTEQSSQPNTPPTGPNKLTGNPRLKKGGVTKATKFAALAAPKNKITFADKIAGAKKNAKKK